MNRLSMIHWIVFISMMLNIVTVLLLIGISFGGHA